MRLGRARILTTAVAAALATTAAIALPSTSQADTTRTYVATDDTFPNPDRGLYTRVDVVNDRSFGWVRDRTDVLHSYIRLDPYRTSSIPQSFVDKVQAGLDAVRSSGLKIILRFAYNFGPYPNCEPDADEDRIKAHLQQLRAVLADNADVVMSFEAGFIGCWGEWHTSTNGLENDTAAKARIRDAILDAFPADRQVALRYPSDIRAVNGTPISSSEAFSGSRKSRTGSHQDCFLASDPDDWGTWGRGGGSVSADKDFIGQNSRYAVTGGETCTSGSTSRVSCQNARDELSWFHFSYLNEDFEAGAVGVLKAQGCFDEIRRRLGYRFSLKTATFPASIDRGGTLDLEATITNSGYAAPFNARPVFAVLDGPGGRRTFRVDSDPRWWGDNWDTSLETTFTVPNDLAPGTYTLALWLPDQYENLRGDPRYSVRFANRDVWDGTNGWNVLGTVAVG